MSQLVVLGIKLVEMILESKVKRKLLEMILGRHLGRQLVGMILGSQLVMGLGLFFLECAFYPSLQDLEHENN